MQRSTVGKIVLSCILAPGMFLFPPETAAEADDARIPASRQMDFYAEMSKTKTLPADRTENSDAQLLDSAAAVMRSMSPAFGEAGAAAFTIKGKKIVVSKNLPREWKTVKGLQIPLLGVFAAHAAVSGSLQRIGMRPEMAGEFGYRIQKELIEAMGESWPEYAAFLERSYTPLKISGSPERLKLATRQLAQILELDRSFDIPYLAGYAQNDPRKIYIHRNLVEFIETPAGEKFSVVPFLLIHEALEKALIDLLALKERSYLRTHQLAQRLEKEAVEAYGIAWESYQRDFMQKNIARAAADSEKLTRVPADLDLTPYRDYEAWDLIKGMKKAAVKVPPFKTGLFKMSMIRPGVVHLQFKERKTLAAMMMRFQEFFESPEFRDRIFERSEFEDWLKKKNGGVADYTEWDGFNFPVRTLEAFYAGKFKHLTGYEELLLEAFRLRRHADVYMIATAGDSAPATFNHEIAHALSYCDRQYHDEVTAILSRIDVGPVKKVLREKYGDYHEAVLDDEVHAWLTHNSGDLAGYGLDLKPYTGTIRRLRAVFDRYNTAN